MKQETDDTIPVIEQDQKSDREKRRVKLGSKTRVKKVLEESSSTDEETLAELPLPKTNRRRRSRRRRKRLPRKKTLTFESSEDEDDISSGERISSSDEDFCWACKGPVSSEGTSKNVVTECSGSNCSRQAHLACVRLERRKSAPTSWTCRRCSSSTTVPVKGFMATMDSPKDEVVQPIKIEQEDKKPIILKDDNERPGSPEIPQSNSMTPTVVPDSLRSDYYFGWKARNRKPPKPRTNGSAGRAKNLNQASNRAPKTKTHFEDYKPIDIKTKPDNLKTISSDEDGIEILDVVNPSAQEKKPFISQGLQHNCIGYNSAIKVDAGDEDEIVVLFDNSKRIVEPFVSHGFNNDNDLGVCQQMQPTLPDPFCFADQTSKLDHDQAQPDVAVLSPEVSSTAKPDVHMEQPDSTFIDTGPAAFEPDVEEMERACSQSEMNPLQPESESFQKEGRN